MKTEILILFEKLTVGELSIRDSSRKKTAALVQCSSRLALSIMRMASWSTEVCTSKTSWTTSSNSYDHDEMR